MSDAQIDDRPDVRGPARYTRRRYPTRSSSHSTKPAIKTTSRLPEQLLHTFGMMLARPPLTPSGNRRRDADALVAAHERLWHLRHPALNER